MVYLFHDDIPIERVCDLIVRIRNNNLITLLVVNTRNWELPIISIGISFNTTIESICHGRMDKAYQIYKIKTSY